GVLQEVRKRSIVGGPPTNICPSRIPFVFRLFLTKRSNTKQWAHSFLVLRINRRKDAVFEWAGGGRGSA
ncbi:MAG TPA: hypothetical protein VL485_06250, partial [Ktedonobacteraceae bacterium]|nr:hypothetical protein [Ktedonobacteraceae bacterium]